MIIGILDAAEHGPWRVLLQQTNYRPERVCVEIEWDASDGEDVFIASRCVAFADDLDAAQQLFDAVSRAVELLATGDCEDLDWMEHPPELGPIL